MARSPNSTTSKARGGRKAREGAAKERQDRAGGNTGAAKARASAGMTSKKSAARRQQGASKARSTSKRGAAKGAGRRSQAQTAAWAAGLGPILSSQLGREILADVLNAAAAVLRQNRQIGRQVQEAGQTMIDRGTDLASTALNVGSEVAAGAVDTGVEITAAAVEMAQAAAGTLAAASTNAMRNVLPGARSGEDEDRQGGGRNTDGKGQSAKHEK